MINCVDCLKRLLDKIEAMRMKTSSIVPLNNGYNAAVDRARVIVKNHKEGENGYET